MLLTRSWTKPRAQADAKGLQHVTATDRELGPSEVPNLGFSGMLVVHASGASGVTSVVHNLHIILDMEVWEL